jgi:hypothetical protein
MKYLKIFEEYNSELYTFISEHEYDDFSRDKESLPFTKGEIESIKSILPSVKDTTYQVLNIHDDPFGYSRQKYKIYIKAVLNEIPKRRSSAVITWLDIWKYSDEWYIIINRLSGQNVIKCDQFDAVLQYINDNKDQLK